MNYFKLLSVTVRRRRRSRKSRETISRNSRKREKIRSALIGDGSERGINRKSALKEFREWRTKNRASTS